MGRYLNTKTMSKEAWLALNAVEVEAHDGIRRTMVDPTVIPVTWVDNGYMTAAGFPDSLDMLRSRMLSLSDDRPRKLYLVPINVLENAVAAGEVVDPVSVRAAILTWREEISD